MFKPRPEKIERNQYRVRRAALAGVIPVYASPRRLVSIRYFARTNGGNASGSCPPVHCIHRDGSPRVTRCRQIERPPSKTATGGRRGMALRTISPPPNHPFASPPSFALVAQPREASCPGSSLCISRHRAARNGRPARGQSGLLRVSQKHPNKRVYRPTNRRVKSQFQLTGRIPESIHLGTRVCANARPRSSQAAS
jgi:hypothetical protein